MTQTLHNIFSKAQADIGDFTFEKIQRQEWLDFAEEALVDISEQSSVWVVTQALPIVTANERSTVTIPANVRPIRTYRVEVDTKLCREYSDEAVTNQLASRTVFLPNATGLTAYAFATSRQPNGDLVLNFAGSLGNTATANVSWYQKTPNETTYMSQTAIPQKVAQHLRYILVNKAIERLLLKVPEYANMYGMTKERATKSEREIQAFYRNLQDGSSISVVEPLRWLGE